jgi:carbon-monoxide dehydrogenase medium subunit
MKPVAFEYCAPTSIAETVSLLAEYGDDARVLAGGQSLVPLLNRRLVRPRVLVDINRVAELAYESHGNAVLELGAMVRHEQVAGSELVEHAVPLLALAARQIGHQAVRSRGSFGGSLAHADPGAELPMLAAVLDARFTAVSAGKSRELRATDFFCGRNVTALLPDELLIKIRMDDLAGASYAFEEFSLRFHHAPVVAAAAVVRLDSDDRVTEVRIGLAGVANVPIRASAVEESLVGEGPDENMIVDAAARATRALEPAGDVHGSPKYRRRLAEVLVRRTLGLAICRARVTS